MPHLLRSSLRYAVAVPAVTLALVLRLLVAPLLPVEAPFLLFFAAVLVSGWYGGLGPGLLATLLSALLCNYFFLPPYSEMAITNPGQATLIGIFILEGVIISGLTATRKWALEAEREQRERLRVTLGSIGDGVIVTDTQGHVTLINQAAQSLTGWTQAGAAAQPIHQVFRIINEETRQEVESPVVKVIREGRVVGLANHTLLVTKDGAEIPIDDSGAPVREASGAIVGVVLVFRDITERKRAEEERMRLLELERAARAEAETARHQLAFLAEASAVLAGSLDYEATLASVAQLVVPQLADWCTVDVVEEDGSLHRLAVEHIDETKVAQVLELQRRYPPDPDSSRGVPQVLRTGRAELIAEIADDLVEFAARSAEHLQILRELRLKSVMIVPLRVRERTLGAISFVSAELGRRYGPADLELAEDLARRAAVAVENARLYRETQAAVRIRDQFFSIASHELKTPLTSLMGYAELLQRRAKRDGTLSERDQRSVAVIVEQAGRLNRLIAALLDLSRIQTGQLNVERGAVDLRALVRRQVDAMQPVLDRHRLMLDGGEEPVVVEGDELRLDQVVQNLVQNAIKYSPEGGAIVVRIERRGEQACLEVTDQGIGIPQAALPQLFRRFYRAPNADTKQIGGMGVGLFVIKEIVELHGGTVEVTSREGEGSTFTVCLPLVQGQRYEDGG